MAPAPASSPSVLAMDRFVAASPGLREPRVAEQVPGLPTLPDLKKLARDRRAAGHEVIDQSAGDIDDVDQPLSDEFLRWIPEARAHLVSDGNTAFRATDGDAYGFPGNYIQQFGAVTAALARSWGWSGPVASLQTLSGRSILDFALRGLLARAADRGARGRPAVILDPLAWSGYGPLTADLGIVRVNAPAVAGHGLAASEAGLRAALDFCAARELDPIAAIPILPSNPTGVGMAADELVAFVRTAAAVDLPVMVDAFYSPLAPEGHAAAVGVATLERELTPEALSLLGTVVGETKVTSSQNKTGSLIWAAPEGHRSVADRVVGVAAKRMRTTNAYPRPQEALVAYALHTFPGGIHAAMGPRYEALNAARTAMRSAADELGLPLSIGGSFYGTLAMVDESGEGLVRDSDGRPLTEPRAVSEALTTRFGLVGAPGGMFSSAPEAGKMVRLTAAVTLDDVARVRGLLAEMLEDARRAP